MIQDYKGIFQRVWLMAENDLYTIKIKVRDTFNLGDTDSLAKVREEGEQKEFEAYLNSLDDEAINYILAVIYISNNVDEDLQNQDADKIIKKYISMIPEISETKEYRIKKILQKINFKKFKKTCEILDITY